MAKKEKKATKVIKKEKVTKVSKVTEVAKEKNKETQAKKVKAGPKPKAQSQKPKIKLKKSEKQGRSKAYSKTTGLIEKGKGYQLSEAFDLVKKTSTTKFDAAVETHIRLGVDLSKSEQQVRGLVVLPHGTGKSYKVIVVCSANKEKEAKSAGAEEVGGEDLVKKIKTGKINFDILVATPDMMGALGKVAKVLGPKGLMPNPKSGTVTMDIEKIVKDIKSGKIEFRTDPTGIIHQTIGRISFDTSKLEENFNTLLEAVRKARPSGIKGHYILSIFLCSTMGPSVKLDLSKVK